MNNFNSTSSLKNLSPNKTLLKTQRRKNFDEIYKSLPSREKMYRQATDLPGLYVKIEPSGKKSWQYRYKNNAGKWSWLGLGSFPKVSYAMVTQHVSDFESGKTEILSKQDKKLIEIQEKQATFGHLIQEYFSTKKKVWQPDTYKKEKQSIEKHLLPVFGDRDFRLITPAEWLRFFTDKQEKEGIYNRIEKLVGYCVGAYDLAKFKGDIEYNPLQNINRFLVRSKSENMKHVNINELADMIFTIRTYSSRSIAIALELLIHMFPRPQELRCARWEQFDFEDKIWIRPADIMKKRIEHAIPLSDQVIKLLHELKEISPDQTEYLFPARDSLNKPISNLTFNAALNRLGYKGRQNPHGFRHIASTNLNRYFSAQAQVIESALSHLKPGVKGAYDKEAHVDERRDLMQWWSDYLDGLLAK